LWELEEGRFQEEDERELKRHQECAKSESERAAREYEEMKRRDAEEKKRIRWQREEDEMTECKEKWHRWTRNGDPVEICNSNDLRTSITRIRDWLTKFEKFESPAAIQFKQDIRDMISRGEKRLRTEREEEIKPTLTRWTEKATKRRQKAANAKTRREAEKYQEKAEAADRVVKRYERELEAMKASEEGDSEAAMKASEGGESRRGKNTDR
jgi:hypothetical protein